MLTTQSEMNASGCIGATPPAQPCTINYSSLSEAKKTHVSEQSVKASISFSSLSHQSSEGNGSLSTGLVSVLVDLLSFQKPINHQENYMSLSEKILN